MTAERKWTFEEVLALYKQDERPTDPDELRMWKAVRHAKHYGAGKERIKKMWENGTLQS